MIKILISGAGGDVAKNLVILLNKNFFTITTSSVLKKYKFSKKNIFTPNITSKNYINVLAKIIKKESIDYFFPCIDAEIPLIAKNNKKLKCKVFVEKFKKVLNCHDKFLTFKYLKKNKINTPYTAVLSKYNIDKFSKPFILKKRVGNASKGIKIINSEKEKKHIKINKNFILQKYLSGNDYTSGVYIDKKNKIYQVILKRNLMNGCTNECWLVNNKNISKQIIKIAKKLNFKYINIQFKVKNNKVYVYELNPRISGTTAFQSHVFNAAENYIRENEKKKILKNKNIKNLYGKRCQKTKIIKKK